MEYKGYTAHVIYDEEEQTLFGHVAGIRDVITFEAASMEQLEKEFHISVDVYLDFCAEEGHEPEKPSAEFVRDDDF